MFTLIKIIAAKILMGASTVPLQVAAVVVLQISSSTIQTNLTDRQVESGQQQIIEQQILTETESAPQDLISASDDGFVIANAYHDLDSLDAPLIALEEGVLNLDRSPASFEAIESNPYQESSSPNSSSGEQSYPAPESSSPTLAQNNEVPSPAAAPGSSGAALFAENLPLPPSSAPPASAAQKQAFTSLPGTALVSGPAASPVPQVASNNGASSQNTSSQGGPDSGGAEELPDAGSGDEGNGGAGSGDEEATVAKTAIFMASSSQVMADRNPVVSEVSVDGLTNEAHQLYIASISYQDAGNEISHFSGFGNLHWTRVDAQCSGNNDVATEVWWAIGDGGDSSSLGVHLRGSTRNLQVAVTQWNEVNELDPIAFLKCEASTVPSRDIHYEVNTTEKDMIVLATAGFMLDLSSLLFNDMEEILQIEGGRGPSGLNLAVGQNTVEAAGLSEVSAEISAAANWSSIAVEIKPRP